MNTAAPSVNISESLKSHSVSETEKSINPSQKAPLSSLVDDVLGQLQSQFEQMSNDILGKIDEMGSRMDELEKVLGNLLEQSNDVITEKVEPVKNGSLESEKE